MSYNAADIKEFQEKDKRIMFQSIFSSLCAFYAGKDASTSTIRLEAFKTVEEILKKYPMKEISQTDINRAGGDPF